MRALTTIACALAMALPALAADAAGKWEATIESPRGEMTYTFDLQADGETLTGSVANEMMGETEIQDGKIDGDNVSFKQVMQRGDRSMTFVYSGKIVGDEMELTRTMEGRGGAAGKRGGPGGPGAREGGKGGGPGGGRGGMGREMTFTAKRVQ